MPSRIDRLTPEQEAQINPWADKWIEIGLCCEPADWETFEEGVRECYKFAEQKDPQIIIKCESPMAAVIVGGIMDYLVENQDKVGILEADTGIVDFVRSYDIAPGVVDSILVSIQDGLRWLDIPFGNVSVQKEACRQSVREAFHNRIGGQFWVSTQAYTSFFFEVCDLDPGGDIRARANAYAKAQKSVSWWIAFDWGVVASNRPLHIHREQIGPRGWNSHRLHCDDGAAILWPDGHALFSIHGNTVPRHVVEAPETITVKEIKSEENAEVRRIMRERFGHGKYLEAINADLIDADFEGVRKGAAPRALIKDDEGGLSFVGNDGSSERSYYMMGAPGVKSCREAHEAIIGTDETRILNKS